MHDCGVAVYRGVATRSVPHVQWREFEELCDGVQGAGPWSSRRNVPLAPLLHVRVEVFYTVNEQHGPTRFTLRFMIAWKRFLDKARPTHAVHLDTQRIVPHRGPLFLDKHKHLGLPGSRLTLRHVHFYSYILIFSFRSSRASGIPPMPMQGFKPAASRQSRVSETWQMVCPRRHTTASPQRLASFPPVSCQPTTA